MTCPHGIDRTIARCFACEQQAAYRGWRAPTAATGAAHREGCLNATPYGGGTDCGCAPASPPVPATLTMIVNGQEVQVPAHSGDRVGVLAHWALASTGYDWLTIELRDAEGRDVPPGTRARHITGPVYVGKPIGWGG